MAAQRAKQLQAGAKPRVETRSRKPTRIAVEETLAEAVSWEVLDKLPGTEGGGHPRSREARHVPVVVLGVTGCIGAYKACEVLRELQKHDVDVHVVMTAAATRFVSPMTFEALSRHPVFHDQFALGENGEIRHISLADDADLLLVAPATANMPRQVRARDRRRRAQHALPRDARAGAGGAGDERQHVRAPRRAGEPRHAARPRAWASSSRATGYLACGWLGKGRLAEVETIVEAALARLARSRDLDGRDGAGHRRADDRGPRPGALRLEPLLGRDGLPGGRGGARPRAPASCWSRVRPRCPTPQGVTFVAVRSADEMQRAVAAHAGSASVVVAAAAVSDYRPARGEPGEAQEDRGPAAARAGAHARHPEGAGRGQGRAVAGRLRRRDGGRGRQRAAKLETKNLDLIVANDVTAPGAGFGGSTNAVVLLRRDGKRTDVPLASKREVAERILDEVIALRTGARVPTPA